MTVFSDLICRTVPFSPLYWAAALKPITDTLRLLTMQTEFSKMPVFGMQQHNPQKQHGNITSPMNITNKKKQYLFLECSNVLILSYLITSQIGALMQMCAKISGIMDRSCPKHLFSILQMVFESGYKCLFGC